MSRFRQPPPILALFLVETIDNKPKVVWAKTSLKGRCDEDELLRGLEYKALPSTMGVGASPNEDVVFFTQDSERGLLEGVSVVSREYVNVGPGNASFHANGSATGGVNSSSQANTRDSRTLKFDLGGGHPLSPVQETSMAIGILCFKGHDSVSSKCWVYIPPLFKLLRKILDIACKFPENPYSNFSYHKRGESSSGLVAGGGVPKGQGKRVDYTPIIINKSSQYINEVHNLMRSFYYLNLMELDVSKRHPIKSLRLAFSVLGPLMFEIWKAALTRCRILFVDLSQTLTSEELGHFVYIVGIISAIPSDVAYLLPAGSSDPLYIRMVYNVTRNDIPLLQGYSEVSPAYVACTTESAFLGHKDLYDVAVVIQPHLQVKLMVSGRESPSDKFLLATPSTRDVRRFEALCHLSDPPISHHGTFVHNGTTKTQDWTRAKNVNIASRWASRVHYAIKSWIPSLFSTDLLYGMMWWATAGENASYDSEFDGDILRLDPFQQNYLDNSYSTAATERSPFASQLDPTRDSFSYSYSAVHGELTSDLGEPWEVTVVGYVHGLSRLLFRIVSTIVSVSLQNDETVVTVEPPDLLCMELSPFNRQDRNFVCYFIDQWWNRPARVSRGLFNLCC